MERGERVKRESSQTDESDEEVEMKNTLKATSEKGLANWLI